MKKNLWKRMTVFCMAALVTVTSLATTAVSAGNTETTPCSDIEPKPNTEDQIDFC